jgi:starch phosphorylase
MTVPEGPPRIGALQLADIVLPEPVDRLHDLVYNLWWTWHLPARRLFAAIDSVAWQRYRNPIELLLNVDKKRWELLIDTDGFMTAYNAVVRSFDRYMDGGRETWTRRQEPEAGAGLVAYFSMEYGLQQSLAIYSGGLGVLSADHLKTSSDLGIPMVAVGLLYRHGYFRQAIDADGFQQHIYPPVDFTRLPVRPALDARGRELAVDVPMPEGSVQAKVWLAQVGRVPLLLLDTDVQDNDAAWRSITGVLYVRHRETRMLQEIVLGIGGARALAALGVEPAVWHINEGHSALLQLERLQRLRSDKGLSFDSALEVVRSTTAFTTHTPVPAGNEVFERRLARPHLAPWAERLEVAPDALLDMGSADHGESGQDFNLSAFALRTSGYANGVSRLNAEVADRMWRHLFPELEEGVSAIDAITNGVHLQTWLGPEVQALLERHLGEQWPERLDEDATWEDLEAIDGADLWEVHRVQKDRLLHFVRNRLRVQLGRHGQPPRVLRALEERLSSRALTIGFARRFATYKRAGLIFSDIHRLRTLVAHPERPVQILVAGKAHPADRPGQDLIRHIFQLSQEPGLKGRVVFLEDYDLPVARKLVQGVDLWLNTPQRLMEASGTSGMKAGANGALNCSILDGWWPEAFDETNGWAIGPREPAAGTQDEDALDSLALYQLLEEEIVPLFFERDGDAPPQGWVEMMKRSILSVGRQFSSARMLRQYYGIAYRSHSRDTAEARETVDSS